MLCFSFRFHLRWGCREILYDRSGDGAVYVTGLALSKVHSFLTYVVYDHVMIFSFTTSNIDFSDNINFHIFSWKILPICCHYRCVSNFCSDNKKWLVTIWRNYLWQNAKVMWYLVITFDIVTIVVSLILFFYCSVKCIWTRRMILLPGSNLPQ